MASFLLDHIRYAYWPCDAWLILICGCRFVWFAVIDWNVNLNELWILNILHSHTEYQQWHISTLNAVTVSILWQSPCSERVVYCDEEWDHFALFNALWGNVYRFCFVLLLNWHTLALLASCVHTGKKYYMSLIVALIIHSKLGGLAFCVTTWTYELYHL